MAGPHKTHVVLLTVRGPDKPGITSRLTAIIAGATEIKILDIEQTVVHKKLLLSILLGFPNRDKKQAPLMKDLLFAARDLGVELGFEVFDSKLLGEENAYHQYVVTCLGSEIGALHLAKIASALAAKKINIDKISKLTLKHIKAVEFICHAEHPIEYKKFSQELLGLSSQIGIDIAIQKHGLLRRAKRLVVMDMDSTLVQSEVIDELAKEAGVGRKVSAITRRAMEGKIPFAKSLGDRAALLAGMDGHLLDRVYARLKLTPGAEKLIRTLRTLGFKIALVSGGFTYFTDRLKEKLGFDYAFANKLEIKDGNLTGRLTGEIIDAGRKALILETIAQGEHISLDQVIAIGDGANDIPMLLKAGFGVAFNAKRAVLERTHWRLAQHPRLDSILYLLGISEREIETLSGNG